MSSDRDALLKIATMAEAPGVEHPPALLRVIGRTARDALDHPEARADSAVPSSHVSEQEAGSFDRATLGDRCVQLLAIKVKELAYQMSREDVEAATTERYLNRHQREAAKETAREFEAAVDALASMAAAVHHEAPEPNQSKSEGESILREALARLIQVTENVRIFVTTRERINSPTGVEWFDAELEAARSALAGMKP